MFFDRPEAGRKAVVLHVHFRAVSARASAARAEAAAKKKKEEQMAAGTYGLKPDASEGSVPPLPIKVPLIKRL